MGPNFPPEVISINRRSVKSNNLLAQFFPFHHFVHFLKAEMPNLLAVKRISGLSAPRHLCWLQQCPPPCLATRLTGRVSYASLTCANSALAANFSSLTWRFSNYHVHGMSSNAFTIHPLAALLHCNSFEAIHPPGVLIVLCRWAIRYPSPGHLATPNPTLVLSICVCTWALARVRHEKTRRKMWSKWKKHGWWN